MSFNLFNLFKKNKNNNRKPLKYYVKNCKPFNGDYMFITIMNDLNMDYQGDKFAIMTYGYARRTVAAILYAQGFLNANEMVYQQEMFQKCQLMTETDYDFQEDAAAASHEFLREYSDWFTPQKAKFITSLAVGGNMIDIKSLGHTFNDQTVMEIIDKQLLKSN